MSTIYDAEKSSLEGKLIPHSNWLIFTSCFPLRRLNEYFTCRICLIKAQASKLSSKKSLSRMNAFHLIDQNTMWPLGPPNYTLKPLTRKSQKELDWDRWTKYLHENDINISRFDRLRWIRNEDRCLALGLNDTGAKMKFNISDQIRLSLTKPITETSELRNCKAQFHMS